MHKKKVEKHLNAPTCSHMSRSECACVSANAVSAWINQCEYKCECECECEYFNQELWHSFTNLEQGRHSGCYAFIRIGLSHIACCLYGLLVLGLINHFTVRPLVTYRGIFGQVPTCDSCPLMAISYDATLWNRTASKLIWYPTQSHYPDTEPTSLYPYPNSDKHRTTKVHVSIVKFLIWFNQSSNPLVRIPWSPKTADRRSTQSVISFGMAYTGSNTGRCFDFENIMINMWKEFTFCTWVHYITIINYVQNINESLLKNLLFF